MARWEPVSFCVFYGSDFSISSKFPILLSIALHVHGKILAPMRGPMPCSLMTLNLLLLAQVGLVPALQKELCLVEIHW